VSREHALRAIRHVQRRFSPQVPNTLRAMGETIMSLRWQGRLLNVLDDINNVPFYQGNLEHLDNNAVVFGGLIFFLMCHFFNTMHHIFAKLEL